MPSTRPCPRHAAGDPGWTATMTSALWRLSRSGNSTSPDAEDRSLPLAGRPAGRTGGTSRRGREGPDVPQAESGAGRATAPASHQVPQLEALHDAGRPRGRPAYLHVPRCHAPRLPCSAQGRPELLLRGLDAARPQRARPPRRSACGPASRSAGGRPGCARPRRCPVPRYTSKRFTDSSRSPPARRSASATASAGCRSSTTRARSMSEDGNRLTAPPTVARRGTVSSSKSSPRSTSSQPIRRGVVPRAGGAGEPERGRRRRDRSPRPRRARPRARAAVRPPDARRAGRVQPGNGGGAVAAGRRPGARRRGGSASASTCQAATASRASSSSRAKTAASISRSPGSSAARRRRRRPARPPAGAPSPGCEKTTPTSNSRMSPCRRPAL